MIAPIVIALDPALDSLDPRAQWRVSVCCAAFARAHGYQRFDPTVAVYIQAGRVARVQILGYRSELSIQYCPWCGADLKALHVVEHVDVTAEALRRRYAPIRDGLLARAVARRKDRETAT